MDQVQTERPGDNSRQILAAGRRHTRPAPARSQGSLRWQCRLPARMDPGQDRNQQTVERKLNKSCLRLSCRLRTLNVKKVCKDFRILSRTTMISPRFPLALTASFLLASSLHAQPLPGTKPLETKEDFAAVMVDG